MSLLCNYSHPELQITDGLIRHETGRLFPYNPEFYDNATGLYGPGAIYCWYMLIASVFVSWMSILDDSKKPGLSSDLLGAIAYPAFAATDLVIQSIRMLGMNKRALAIFCLRNPDNDLINFGPFNTTQLDLNHIPPDVLGFGQRVIDITGPIAVCYSAALFLVPLLITAFVSDAKLNFEGSSPKIDWKPSSSASWIVYTTYGYLSLMLIIFQLSLGDITISLFIFFYEAVLSLALVVMYQIICSASTGILCGICLLVSSLVRRNHADVAEALEILGWGIPVGGLLLITPIFTLIYIDKGSMIPDLGIKVSERDQLATLIVGVVTLAFTLVEVGRNFYRPRNEVDGESEEMEMLPASDV